MGGESRDNTPNKLPSQFLRSLDPHLIYDAAELAMDYCKEIGLYPSWPVHSARRAQLDVLASGGKDCWMNTSEPMATVCYGFEVAEAVAKSQLTSFAPLPREDGRFMDMREAYERAILALEEAGR